MRTQRIRSTKLTHPMGRKNKEHIFINKKISPKKIEASCEEVSALLRSLSHPQRLMLLGHLIQGKKTVSQLQSLCDISQSQISQFLTRMKIEGLIDAERDGRYQNYYVSNARVAKLIAEIQKIFCSGGRS